MKTTRILSAVFLTLFAIAESNAEGLTGPTLYNPPSGSPPCVSTAINQPTAEKAGAPSPQTPGDPDGSFDVTINVYVSAADECEEEKPITGTIVAKPESGTGAEKSMGYTLDDDNGLSDDLLFTFSSEDIRNSAKWNFYLDDGSTSFNYVDFETSDCSSCSAQSGSCDPVTAQGSFLITIPTQAVNGGMTKGTLYFLSEDFTFPGRAGLTAVMPPSFEINRDNDGLITSIDTGTGIMEMIDGPGNNALTIIHKDATNAIFRETVVSLVDVNGNPHFRMDSGLTVNGIAQPKTRHEQYEDTNGATVLLKGRVIGNEFQSIWREEMHKDTTTPGTEVKLIIQQERTTPADAWQTASAIETTWENHIKGWVKTKEIIDPDRVGHTGAKLTSTWEYYQPGETTGPNASVHGLGKLKRHVRYDGYESFHLYGLHFESVTTPYAGIVDGKTVTTTHAPGSNTTTVTTTVGGQILSKNVSTRNINNDVHTVYTSSGQTLTTITHYKMQGTDFILKPTRIEHPDGTLTTHGYTRLANGGYTTVTENGATSNNQAVSLGLRTTTTVNSRGTTIHRKTEAIGYSTDTAVFDEMAVTEVDSLGRATKTAYHPASVIIEGDSASAAAPAWNTTVEYSCCGIAKEIDKYGIKTFHAHDHLQRRIKTNRLGVTTETQYLGLTTETHRYADPVEISLSPALTGTATTLVGRSVRSLTGTLQESWSPDPSSATAGVLVKSSSTVTTYQPDEGLSRRTVTTVPGNHSQTTDSFLDGRTAATHGDLSPAMQYTYTVNATGELTTQSYLDGDVLKETTTTQSDWAGRTLQTAKGTIVTNHQYFDNDAPVGSRGKLKSTTDSDTVTTLYAYNARGERTTTALKLDNAVTITPGTDQITFSESSPALREGTPVMRTINQVSYTSSSTILNPVVSQTDRTPDGLKSWTWQIGRGTTHTHTVLNSPSAGDWTVTTTQPDQTKQIQHYTNGLLTLVESRASGNALIASTGYQYDDFKRLWKQTDSRTGTTTTTTEYLSLTADIVKSITEPGTPVRKTSFNYDSRGRRTHVDAPNTPNPAGGEHANITETIHNPDGSVHEVKGDQTYRVQYGYDYAARMKTMTTYGTEPAATTWFYNQATGLLDRKQYQGGNGTSYEYTPAGRLAKRTWQRGVFTEYYYDSGGRQRAIDYSDGTPDVLFTLDALGSIVTEAQGTLAFNGIDPVMDNPDRAISHTHDSATLLPESETHALGGLTRTLVRTHDTYGRPEVVAAGIDTDNDPATLETTEHYTGYFFGTDGRLLGIDAKDLPRLDQKDYGIEYSYTPNSAHLIHTLTRAGSGSTADLVTTHTWDPTRDILSIKDNRLDGAAIPVSQFDYTVNLLGQRDKVETAGSAFGGTDRGWTWGYDNLGQVTAASHTADSELDRSYLFDGIGNRLESTVGDSTTVTTEYDPNPLNQYSSITIGAGNPLTPVHDSDGNLTEDAAHNKNNDDREYVWDAENRLIAVNKVTARDTSGEITGTSALITYAYDSRSRRISRSVGVSPTSTTYYLYDGWNVVAEYTDNGVDPPALSRTHTWGTDLSGTMQGAGGVGGLLAVRVHGDEYPGNYYPTFDGNGNVSEYLTDTGVRKAHYEYDPFGSDITPATAGGDLHGFFTYRFSTKPFDDISGWFYYGYRYYDPVTGRWPSRDPLGEHAFFGEYDVKYSKSYEDHSKLLAESLMPGYLFLKNNPNNYFDFNGLQATPSAIWKSCYLKFRRDSKFGPKKACDKTNEELGDNQSCSSLGCSMEPSLYAGPRRSRIEQDALWLRLTGDGDLGGITLGADKLAHCYAFCVATSYYYFPLATYYSMRQWAGMEDSDPEDTAANEAGFNIGRANALNPIARFLGVTQCVKDCSDATYNMNFN